MTPETIRQDTDQVESDLESNLLGRRADSTVEHKPREDAVVVPGVVGQMPKPIDREVEGGERRPCLEDADYVPRHVSKATAAYDAALGMPPGAPREELIYHASRLITKLARMVFDKGDAPQAIDLLRTAERMPPPYGAGDDPQELSSVARETVADYHLFCSMIYRNHGDFKEAEESRFVLISLLESGCDLQPRTKAKLFLEVGDAFRYLGDSENAKTYLAQCSEVLASLPRDASTDHLRALLFHAQDSLLCDAILLELLNGITKRVREIGTRLLARLASPERDYLKTGSGLLPFLATKHSYIGLCLAEPESPRTKRVRDELWKLADNFPCKKALFLGRAALAMGDFFASRWEEARAQLLTVAHAFRGYYCKGEIFTLVLALHCDRSLGDVEEAILRLDKIDDLNERLLRNTRIRKLITGFRHLLSATGESAISHKLYKDSDTLPHHMDTRSEAGAMLDSVLKGQLVRYLADIPLTQEVARDLKLGPLSAEYFHADTSAGGWLEEAICSSVHSSYVLAAKRQLLFSNAAILPGIGTLEVIYESASGECQFTLSAPSGDTPSPQSVYVTRWTPRVTGAKRAFDDRDLMSLLAVAVSDGRSVQEATRLRAAYIRTAPPINAVEYLDHVGRGLAERLRKELLEAYESLLVFLSSRRAALAFVDFGHFQPANGQYAFVPDNGLTDYLSASFELMNVSRRTEF